MKKQALLAAGVCLASVLGLGLGSRPAFAETADLMRVTLPYAVQVGTVTMPAGEMTITDIRDNGNSSILVLRSASGESMEAVAERIAAPISGGSSQSRVVFRHVGNKYQMEKIWMLGRDYGFDLKPMAGRG